MRANRVNHLLQVRQPSFDAPARPKRVLVVEEEPFAADEIAAQLRDRKHTAVTWCRGSAGRVDCAEKAPGECPLHGPVDIVLDVRTGTGAPLTGGELGVACAGLAGIPVVAAGPVRPTAEEAPWALARCTVDEAAEFCSQALAHPDPWAKLRLDDLVRRVVDLSEDDVGRLRVDLVRWPGAVTVAVTVIVATTQVLSAATCAAIDQAVRTVTPRVAPDGQEIFLSFTCL